MRYIKCCNYDHKKHLFTNSFRYCRFCYNWTWICNVLLFGAKSLSCSINDQLQRNVCLQELAKSRKDISICNEIYGTEAQSECYSDVSDLVAISVSLCDGLKNGWGKDQCYYTVATKNRDVSVCGRIQDKGHSNCYGDVAASTDNISICEKITADKEKNKCFYTFATRRNSESVCQKIVDGHTKDSCYGQISSQKNDTGICSNIIDTVVRDSCYQSSSRTPSFSTCPKVQSVSQKDRCYLDAIHASLDYSCDKAVATEKDICFTNVAYFRSDKSFCDQIVDKAEKGRCLAKVLR